MNGLTPTALDARRARVARVRDRMGELAVDVLLLSHGADLPWLTGYRAMPLERLTVLVLPLDGDPVLVVPGLEAPRVADGGDLFSVRSWSDAEDPIDLVVDLVRSSPAGRLAVSDRAWATTVLALQARLPGADLVGASAVTSPIRAVKDHAELAALRAAAAAADRVAAVLQAGGDPACRADRGGGLGRPGVDAGGRGPQCGQFRHRRERAQRRQSPPRARRPDDRSRRDSGLRLRRHPVTRRRRRVLLGHHPYGGDRRPVGTRCRTATTSCSRPSRRRWRRPGPV